MGHVFDATEMEESLKGKVGFSSTLKRRTETQKSMLRVDRDNGVLKKRRISETESKKQEETGNGETEDTKKVLGEWRKIKGEKRNRSSEREAARLELEQIKNTAGFEENMEALREFEILVGEYPKYYTGYNVYMSMKGVK